MPISESCFSELRQLDTASVMLVVGLKENPNLFLPLEYRAGREGEPVAVRYSLGWTVIGPVGGVSCSTACSANFLHLVDSSIACTSSLNSQN